MDANHCKIVRRQRYSLSLSLSLGSTGYALAHETDEGISQVGSDSAESPHTAVVGAVSSQSYQRRDDISDATRRHALAEAARLLAVQPQDVSLLAEATVSYPLQRKSVAEFKYRARGADEVISVALDLPSLKPISSDGLWKREDDLWKKKYGAMSPDLVQRLSSGVQLQEVMIWLKKPIPGQAEIDREGRIPESDVIARRQANRDLVEPFISRLRQHVSDPGQVSAPLDFNLPYVTARVGAADLQRLATLDEVESIDAFDLEFRPELNIARVTDHVSTVHSRGINGSGVKIGLLDVNHNFGTGNQYISGVQKVNLSGIGSCSSTYEHMAAVAGIVRSTEASTWKGLAPSATVYASSPCSTNASQIEAAANLLVTGTSYQVNVLNMSLGSEAGDSSTGITAIDKVYDKLAWDNRVTIVKSAGNTGGRVTPPGRGYNVITVGAYNDYGSTSWGGDTMWPQSAYIDPTSSNSDRDKPELVAPGVGIASTSVNAGCRVGVDPSPRCVSGSICTLLCTTEDAYFRNSGDGTSRAAAQVSAVAALLMHRNATYKTWPELVKATLMAGTAHNVEGNSVKSEYDGAGALDADFADDIARQAYNISYSGRYVFGWKTFDYNCSTAPSVTSFVVNQPPEWTKATFFRVAAVWGVDPNGGTANYDNRPGADLDLEVIPNVFYDIDVGQSYSYGSYSWDNNFEIASGGAESFIGGKTVRIIKKRCDVSPRRLAVAYMMGGG